MVFEGCREVQYYKKFEKIRESVKRSEEKKNFSICQLKIRALQISSKFPKFILRSYLRYTENLNEVVLKINLKNWWRLKSTSKTSPCTFFTVVLMKWKIAVRFINPCFNCGNIEAKKSTSVQGTSRTLSESSYQISAS